MNSLPPYQRKMADLQEYEKQLIEIKERYKIAPDGDSKDLDAFLVNNTKPLSLDNWQYQWQSWTCFNQWSVSAKRIITGPFRQAARTPQLRTEFGPNKTKTWCSSLSRR
jgi:hypothetical protein